MRAAQLHFLSLFLFSFRYPRSVTVPFVAGEGWGFEVTGGNAVGIFISKVSSSRKELLVREIHMHHVHTCTYTVYVYVKYIYIAFL